MKERCTIKEVSELLGISTDTIRLYEKEGLVKPERDQKNGYRYYSSLTIQRILGILMYRKMNASIRDIEQILQTSNLSDLAVNCSKIQETNEKKIQELQDINNKLNFMRQHIINCHNSLHQFSLQPMERFYAPDPSDADSLDYQRSLLEDYSCDYFSYGNECFILTKTNDGNITSSKHMYAIREPMLKVSPLKNQIDTLQSYSEELCVHTVVEIIGKNYTKDIFFQMIKFAEQNGYKTKDYLYSFYVISIGDEELPKNYYELYLPLQID